MFYYDLFGSINTLCIFLSLIGVYAQLNTVLKRKKLTQKNGGATAQLSVNQFSVSFLAYLSFFIYGYSIKPFNHYIIWPRLIAATLVTMILYQIWQDRRNRQSLWVGAIAIILLCLANIGLLLDATFEDQGRLIATSIILVISILIAQGYYHQIRLIIKSGETGAVDLKMSQFIFVMDVSTIAFALSMGLNNGWPLLVLAITSGVTKIIMMYLFYWVNHSPVAQLRAAQKDS